MTDTEGEFADHARFEREAGGFVPTTNDWDATVVVADGDVEITVTVPTLDAVVEGDDVADVVTEGWYDTFERRVADADGVTLAKNVTDPEVARTDGEVTVELTLTPREGKAADDALALVNFVEGTWFEGVVPGYDYVEKVQEMRQQAARNAQNAEGTPL